MLHSCTLQSLDTGFGAVQLSGSQLEQHEQLHGDMGVVETW